MKKLDILLLFLPVLSSLLVGFWLYLQDNISGTLACVVFFVLWFIVVAYTILQELRTK